MIAILRVQVRRALLVSMQYRLDFVLEALMCIFWMLAAVTPLFVLFSNRKTIAGWTWAEALIVVACFTTLKGALHGVIQPSMQAVVGHVRKGTLDFLLLKPADAQLLLSTSQIELWRSGDVFAGLIVFGYALRELGYVPGVLDVLLMIFLLGVATAILYAIFICVISLAFRVVKVDNLTYLLLSIFDAARWPSSVFRGVFAIVFTFVIPLGLMTTYPALALLHRLSFVEVLVALATATAFLLFSRLLWTRSIRHYTSAGG